MLNRVKRHLAFAILALLPALLAGCGPRGAPEWASVREVTPGFLATRHGSDAALAADRHGRVALTWVTSDSLGQDLWLALSSDSGFTFSEPVRVNPRRGSVSSYAECRPVVAYGPAGELLVAWSDRRGDSMRIADLVVRASGDGGLTLGPPAIVNDDAADRRPVFHGFPALTALPGGGWFAVWMDEREAARTGNQTGVASLFHARSQDGGQSWSDNRLLTHRACACCRVSAVSDAEARVAVAYRAVAGDVRDPALALSFDGGATFALDTLFSADGWRLAGCPLEGPSVALDPAGGGHFAWHTGAGTRGTWLAPWRADGVVSGVRRSLTDSLVAARHPQLVRLGAAMLIAVEGRALADSGRTVIAVRALVADGTLTPWLFLGADARHGWMAASGERTALVCWTEHDPAGDRVRVARLTRRRG